MSRQARSVRTLCLVVLFTIPTSSAIAVDYKTPNYVVHAPTLEIATRVARAAELYRERLAFEWLGKTMPRWSRPCQVTVKVGQVGAGGATKFSFHRGHVFNWRMTVQGPLDRILDSVLPHEICHTIFACHFRRPLPRWADEGAATLAEDDMEKKRQRKLAVEVLKQRRRIPLAKLFAIKDYPQDMQQIMTLYAQGFSLADFLVRQGGKRRYLQFLEHAHQSGWKSAVKQHYDYNNVADLEKNWDSWVMAGSPSLKLPQGQLVAARDNAESRLVVRSQSPDHTSDSPKSNPASSWSNRQSSKPQTKRSTDRGQDLHAPDPRASVVAVARTRTRRSSSQLPKTVINDGHRHALNAGWVPVSNWKSSQPKRNSPRPTAIPVSFVQ